MSRAFHKEEIVIPIHHVGVLATGLSTTAAAAPAAPAPAGTLVLAAFSADHGGVRPRLVTLECDPDGGGHAAPGSAYRETFSNRCVLLRATGEVFDF